MPAVRASRGGTSGNTFSNRRFGVLRWAGKYGLVKALSSKVVKALVRAI